MNACTDCNHEAEDENMDVRAVFSMERGPHLILQMNDRRAPMLILADDCWLSFFTVPVFRSNILPLKANTNAALLLMLHMCALHWAGRAVRACAFWTCVVVLCSGELLPELLRVVWVQLIVEGGAKPVGLRLVEDGRHGVRDVNDASSFA